MGIKLTNFREFTQNISTFQKTQMPFVLSYALNQTAFYLVRNERTHIQGVFNRTVALTANAPMTKPSRITKESLKFEFFLRDEANGGNSPDRYLEPQVSSGEVYVTRFTRRLRHTNHIGRNQYVLHWLPQDGRRVTPGLITQILGSLGSSPEGSFQGRSTKRGQKNAGRFFILGGNREPSSGDGNGRRKGDGDYKGPGIYEKKGSGKQLVMRILDKPPTVPAKYDWNEERIVPIAEKQFTSQVLAKLREF